jgi:hypothetical protein
MTGDRFQHVRLHGQFWRSGDGGNARLGCATRRGKVNINAGGVECAVVLGSRWERFKNGNEGEAGNETHGGGYASGIGTINAWPTPTQGALRAESGQRAAKNAALSGRKVIVKAAVGCRW